MLSKRRSLVKLLRFNKSQSFNVGMDKIFYKNRLIGVRLKKIPRGSIPMTDEIEPLQIVTLKHSRSTYLKAHMHSPKRRMTRKLQECLMVKKGKVKIDLYGPDKKLFKKIILKSGDFFLLVAGGYGIHLLENSELIEVKNGPFKEDKVLI